MPVIDFQPKLIHYTCIVPLFVHRNWEFPQTRPKWGSALDLASKCNPAFPFMGLLLKHTYFFLHKVRKIMSV